nr:hypothetical protein [uncultured Draconibacterium sp.]
MKNEKINTKIQEVNAEQNTANEKWETPEVSVILVNETLADINGSTFDGLGFS